MMARFCWSLLVVCALLAGAAVPVHAADAAAVKEIGITYVKFPLNVPAIVACKKGLYEKEFGPDGITVTHPELTAGPKQTQALAAGSVQFASVLSSTSAIVARANGIDLKVIAVFARAPKAFNIMAIDPAIKTVADLKGKIVAGAKGSLLNQLLFAALAKAGLAPSDIQFVNMPSSQAKAAVLGGSAAAALVAGPGVPAVEAAGGRVIANGDGLVEGVIVVAVSGDFLNQHPDLVKRYLAVHDAALRFMREQPEETCALVAAETKLGVDDVKRMLPWYDFNPAITARDTQDLEATQDFLLDNGMIEKKIAIADLVATVR
ncbi:MAG: ABC transporter substrate-binding protein [Desulfovibrionaceae bacterium]